MMINFRLLIVIAIFASVGCSPESGDSKKDRFEHKVIVPGNLLEHTKNQLQGIPVASSIFDLSENMAIMMFVHHRKLEPGWYGTIYVMYEKKNNNLIWTLKWLMDFEPHTFAYIDFNKDVRKDIIFYAGFEDVSITKVYLSKLDEYKHSDKNFVLAYQNDNDYVMLADIDKDGVPELLEAIPTKKDHMSFCSKEGEFPEYSKETRFSINNEYDRIVGKFDYFNFKYGSKEYYKSSNINILNKVRPLQIVYNKVVDVSNKYKNHFKWRYKTLLQIKKDSPNSCHASLNELLKYNKSKL